MCGTKHRVVEEVKLMECGGCSNVHPVKSAFIATALWNILSKLTAKPVFHLLRSPPTKELVLRLPSMAISPASFRSLEKAWLKSFTSCTCHSSMTPHWVIASMAAGTPVGHAALVQVGMFTQSPASGASEEGVARRTSGAEQMGERAEQVSKRVWGQGL